MNTPLTAFFCLRCSCRLGVWPETARGIAPCCAACAALPPTVHAGWTTPPPARLGQSAAERRRDVA